MKTVLSAVFILFCVAAANSQNRKNKLTAGAEFSYPLAQPFQKNNATGIGINLQGEHNFSTMFSATISIGYSHFNGNLIYWNGKMDNNFALIPVFIGARYRLHRFYAGLEAGPAVKASKNVYTNFAIAPSLGYLHKRIDISLRLLGIPASHSIPENTFLQKGGYSYLGIKVNYIVLTK